MLLEQYERTRRVPESEAADVLGDMRLLYNNRVVVHARRGRDTSNINSAWTLSALCRFEGIEIQTEPSVCDKFVKIQLHACV